MATTLDTRARFDLATGQGRMRAWGNALFIDHGALRIFWRNRDWVIPGVLARSNQPLPWQIGTEARAGIRTIINLRGHRPACGSDVLAREAAARAGITMVDAPFESRGAPHRDRLLRLAGLLETVAYPALIHCKSGADRAGLIAAVILLLRGGTVAEARPHLSLRYGHVAAGKTGILDLFLDRYEAAQRETGIGFLDWVRNVYDEAALRRDFRAGKLGSFVTERLLRRE
ncbi:beta-lactamase hydrolase domain-containing protein [Elioraea sp.]|uniref:phosphatase domain-containing protein n=1 Tax=Elioraea sp. TaxID=2185103 RepID=UPI0025C6D05D|nr:sulfur transferase domain-containing protein [Elioraea sp.]